MTASVMFERRRHALVAGLALIGIAASITIIVAADRRGSVLQSIDDWWLERMTDVRTPWLTRVANVLSVLGGPFVMVPLRLGVIGALAWTRRWLQLGAFVGATISSELCIGPLKALIDRPRPPGSLIETNSASFPSGHAIAASVTAIGLVVVLAPSASRRTRWIVAAASFALLMAMSRTYLAAHWASDVVAGACVGTGLAVGWPAALELAWARRQLRRDRPDLASGSREPTAQLRAISVALLCIGSACVVALHVMRRDLEPRAHRLSEYANGPYGYVMTLAFVSIGAGLLVLGLALASRGDRGRWSGPVQLAVAFAGAGMIVSGIFRTDANRAGEMTDAIHSRASAAATLALIVAAVISAASRGGPWRAWRPDATGALAVAAVALGGASPFLHRSDWTGVSQRLLWLTLLAWVLVIAWRLDPGRASPGPPTAR